MNQLFHQALVALPVATEIPRGARLGALHQNVEEHLAVAHAAVVFPVGGFIGVVVQVHDAELVYLSVLHAAEAREVAFSHIGSYALSNSTSPSSSVSSR